MPPLQSPQDGTPPHKLFKMVLYYIKENVTNNAKIDINDLYNSWQNK